MIEITRTIKPRNGFCIVYTDNEFENLKFMGDQLKAEKLGWA